MRTRSCRPLGAAVLVAVLLGSGAAFAGPPEIVEDQRKVRTGKPAAPWTDLKSGLKKSRKYGRPIVLVYTTASQPKSHGRDDNEDRGADSGKTESLDLAEIFEGFLRDSSFKRTVRDYVLIRLGPDDLDAPYPPLVAPPPPGKRAAPRRRKAPVRDAAQREPAGKKLVLHAEKSALLVLSFREEVVARYLGELPKRSVLRKELSRIAKVNKVFVKEDRRVGAILEKSLYAFEAGKRKAAVELVLPFEKPNSRRRMDDTLKSRVDGVIKKYRKVAETEMKKGDLLDDKRKYKEAMDVFEVVLQDFPFPDIRKQAAIRKGEIWREIQLFTRIRR